MGVQFLHPWWPIAGLGIVCGMVLRTLGETSPRSRRGVCGLGTWSSGIAAVSETASWSLNYDPEPVVRYQKDRKRDTLKCLRGQASKCDLLRFGQVSPGLGCRSYPV